MAKLNKDILYLIFEELKEDNNTLYSCLSTNRTWCKIVIPILWKNPWKFIKYWRRKQMESFLNVIFLHLSNESKNTLKSRYIEFLPFLENPYQRPLFDYVSFCRHLDFIHIDYIILEFTHILESKNALINELINLFINRNREFTHLYIPYKFNFQIHLIPEARSCFSEIEFLSIKTGINQDIAVGLSEICKSIKKLDLYINGNNYDNYGVVKLIEVQRNLINLDLKVGNYLLFSKTFENSLIKSANNIQYLRLSAPYTRFLTYFVNLKVLELNSSYACTLLHFENLSLPFLQILRARGIPYEVLTNIIRNTIGYLVEIKIDRIHHNEVENKKIIQVIRQNCPNLINLKLVLIYNNILELENLLINCQYLNGLYIITDNNIYVHNIYDWDMLFEILTKLSPTSLFKFKFSYLVPNLNSLKLFFDNWKDRHPMYLQLNKMSDIDDLMIENYKSEGIVKKFSNKILGDDFEWA
ncbi:hypothetical protein RclHR1_01660018 [Rhizophagus clarus]|uniref:F-box domain-containing protein n=1 Tax=Rhizophagus clarus TaxID=94130 RepID=A0A2Z6QVB2_9GLOM|nr:hypothetical protein RclHR1_01660018 [Rhizophagus clarus]GES74752.1 hypothetical protein GLOIN_2v1777651 [Rhizophagus clarus]